MPTGGLLTAQHNLFNAAKNGDKPLAISAIESGADINFICPNGKSLLQVAAEAGHRNVCEALAAAGADPNECQGARRHSLLHKAAISKNLGMASILLDLGAQPSPKALNNATPLHVAARTGQQYLTRKILDAGGDIDVQDNEGRTPLRCAVDKGDSSIAKILLQKNCDYNLGDRLGRTPLAVAEANDDKEITEMLSAYGATVDTTRKCEVQKRPF